MPALPLTTIYELLLLPLLLLLSLLLLLLLLLVAFSSRAGILENYSTIHSPPALFFFF